MSTKLAIPARVPFVALQRQIDSVRRELEEAFTTTLSRTDFVAGAGVQEFERRFASFCQTSSCVGVANGTDALTLILTALGLSRGGEVITVPNTFIATIEAVHNAGLKPVFVDVDPTTRLMDPSKIEDAIRSNTVAILPVHLYGAIAEMDQILEIARRHGLPVVEDACQAHGAEFNKKRAGSFGIAAAFSFYPAKNLGCFGDGGAVTSNDSEFIERVRTISCHGSRTKYIHERSGFNSRLDTLQARILSALLPKIDDWNQRRRKLAAAYERRLSECTSIRLPASRHSFSDVYHLFVIAVENRDACKEFLSGRGVDTGIHYPYPVYTTPEFSVPNAAARFPIADRLCRQILSLPMHPFMTTHEIDSVVEALQAWNESGTR